MHLRVRRWCSQTLSSLLRVINIPQTEQRCAGGSDTSKDWLGSDLHTSMSPQRRPFNTQTAFQDINKEIHYKNKHHKQNKTYSWLFNWWVGLYVNVCQYLIKLLIRRVCSITIITLHTLLRLKINDLVIWQTLYSTLDRAVC